MLKILTAVLVLGSSLVMGEGKVQIESLAWMAGCWKGNVGGGIWREHWMAPEGGTMLSMSRYIKEGKTAFTEFTRIEERDGGLVFIAVPIDQPKVEFKLTRSQKTEAVFENPEHDFPKKITYRKEPRGTLHARTEGLVDGKPYQVEFHFSPVSCN